MLTFCNTSASYGVYSVFVWLFLETRRPSRGPLSTLATLGAGIGAAALAVLLIRRIGLRRCAHAAAPCIFLAGAARNCPSPGYS
jgi:hypothetical protein